MVPDRLLPAERDAHLSSLGQYFATATDDGVQLWQFAPSRVAVTVAGHPFELTVSTDYPLSGRISVRVEQAGPEPVELGLRVPGWAQSAHGMVRSPGNGNVLAGDPQPGTVWRIRSTGNPGTSWSSTCRCRAADHCQPSHRRRPRLRRRGTRTAGVCLEETDAGGPAELEALILPADAAFTAVHTEISEPIIALAAPARQQPLPTPAWPYSSLLAAGTSASGQVGIHLIPYSTWGNRHPGQAMRVWLPAT